MIDVTENAKNKITELMDEENDPSMFLRTFVQGGGCSGFSYGFTFEDYKNEDDIEIKIGKYSIVVDAMSMMYLDGSSIDYEESLMGASFKIKNPNAETTCGCGSSFSV
jgi:iron-sulfur cluster insertion protein